MLIQHEPDGPELPTVRGVGARRSVHRRHADRYRRAAVRRRCAYVVAVAGLSAGSFWSARSSAHATSGDAGGSGGSSSRCAVPTPNRLRSPNGGSPGEAFERDAAERVDVARRRRLPTADELRRQVVERPEHLPWAGQHRVGDTLRETEIGQRRRAVLAKQDVRRLDISVDDAAPMKGVQACRHLGHHPQHLLETQRPIHEPRRERAARQVLEHEVGMAVLLARGQDPDEVRIRDLPRGPHLVGQTGLEGLVGGERRVERLDRHDPAVRRATAVDDTDRTPSELGLERVVAESQCVRHGPILRGRRREGARLPVGSDPLPGSEIAGFRLEELLGRGGMGAVYRAEDVRLGRKVALKLLVPELAESERFRERFFRESQVAASLDHPHIVPIYAAGEADGRLYLAMRYVEGYDLRQLIAREAPLDPDRAMRLIEQVGDALDAAHERGLVHRDVKPANVLIAGRPDREHCYLTDFGLTKQTSSISGLTGTGELVGTIEYVSPEQIRGETVDARADVYSLGCVLYECLTGERPFARDSEVATLWAHVNEPPPALAASHPELGNEIDLVMTRSLAKAPGDRYPTCGELVASARAALGLPDALSPSTRQRPRRARRPTPTRWPVRVRALVGAAAAVVVLAVVVGAVLLRGSDHLTEIRPMSVGVIDPSTGELVADIPIGFESQLIAAGEGFVWVLDPKASTLTRIDPETMEVVAPTRGIPAEGIPVALAVGEGSVWVAVNEGRALAVIELGPELGNVRSRIVLQTTRTGTFSVLREAVALAVGEHAVWALERGQGEVTRIDPRTGTPKRLAEGHGASSSIAAGGGAVWLGGINGVSKLDPATGTELGSTFVAQVLDSQTTAIAVRGADVWFTGSSSPRLWHIDSGGETVLDSFAVGAGPSAVAVGEEGIAWVASSVDESVWRVDPKAESGERIGLGASPGGILTFFERVWASPGTPLR